MTSFSSQGVGAMQVDGASSQSACARSGRAQAPGSGDSGHTSAPGGLGPRRRVAGSEIGSMVMRAGSRSLAATVITRSLCWRTATQ